MASDIESDEAFDEEDLSDGFDASVLETEDGVEIDEDAIDVDGVEDVEDDEVVVEDVTLDAVAVVVDDEDDISLDQDVELALDEVLAETMRLTTEVDEDDDAVVEAEDKTDPTETVLPKQDDEFRCTSCRLLKKMSQLADPQKTLCRDCV